MDYDELESTLCGSSSTSAAVEAKNGDGRTPLLPLSPPEGSKSCSALSIANGAVDAQARGIYMILYVKRYLLRYPIHGGRFGKGRRTEGDRGRQREAKVVYLGKGSALTLNLEMHGRASAARPT